MNHEPLIDQDLLALWGSQDTAITRPEPDAVRTTLDVSYRQEERRLTKLTVQEVLPSIGVAAVFAWFGLMTDQRQWAFFAAAFLALAVGGFLLAFTITQRASADGFGDSVRSQLERSLVQLGNRAWLYRNVAWWYLAPIGLSVTLVAYGMEVGGLALAIAGPLYAAFLATLFVTNRRIGQRYQAEYDRIETLRQELDRTD